MPKDTDSAGCILFFMLVELYGYMGVCVYFCGGCLLILYFNKIIRMENQKMENKAFEELFNAGLSKEQKRIVDRALSAASQCGVAYGKVAYRLGLHDGIRLMTEIKTIRSLFF